ncbi:PfkB family carbohydrate kinase [Promethearchaeum syntrophicum]|uniref:PfkB family carbohydrate kinase n=1 Tax=Promethearchaeum syntrophicum TaxID=2594042 RepID=A0A5B9DEQ6_9ARCH|nr:sugar kinase [Candidatus Prometheoarchaeum syntrophicum]QEE17491.1 2-dehydro-3-deoxygluconokinase/2-dehydro-3-deoxygalactonokinase [Candidatus Prometheoarchaeum syntrophicum]
MRNYVVTLGEIMLRLKSPNFERLLQNPVLKASFGGSESNVAISLANFGIPSRFVSALPNNQLGLAVIRFLKSMNVDTSYIQMQGTRLGTYYLETGSGPRPSKVIYDRSNSSISQAKTEDFDWDLIFKDVKWFHISGITPALSQKSADISLSAIKFARNLGINISCDLNYRKNLWNYGKPAKEVMGKIVPLIDIIIANEEDLQKSLGIEEDQIIGTENLDPQKYEKMLKKVSEQFPNIKIIATTLRESFSADHNDWSALCYEKATNTTFFSRKYALKNIVDRVGAGDAFAGGFIYGIYSKLDIQGALEFAVAASTLKHTIPGDINRVSIKEVKNFLEGESSGRVQR